MINGRGQSLSGTGEAATLDLPLGAWRIAKSQQVHPNEAPPQRGPTAHEAPEPIAVGWRLALCRDASLRGSPARARRRR